jgi:hypothetical protein
LGLLVCMAAMRKCCKDVFTISEYLANVFGQTQDVSTTIEWRKIMNNRIGQQVRILGGMSEFVGKTGTIVGVELGRPVMFRVRLDKPVEVPYVGLVKDDLWEGNLLRRVGKN